MRYGFISIVYTLLYLVYRNGGSRYELRRRTRCWQVGIGAHARGTFLAWGSQVSSLAGDLIIVLALSLL